MVKVITTLRATLAGILDAANHNDCDRIQTLMAQVADMVCDFAEHVSDSYTENGWSGMTSELEDAISRVHVATYQQWFIYDIVDIVDEVEALEGVFGDEETSKMLNAVFDNPAVVSATGTV
jgi:hypothetical protein